MDNKVILEVNHLRTYFETKSGVVPAVDDISFQVREKEVFCIVGESGCGKTVTSLSILNLIPPNAGKIMEGSSVKLEGKELTNLPAKEMYDIRGNDISMIFQDPMTSLNPVLTIEKQLTETIMRHMRIKKNAARARAVELLNKVGIPSPEMRLKEYPHELSGGMRQRVMIAMALSCDPRILIADEPTTALDVTIQAQILQLMLELKDNISASVIMITHDLGVVADIADRIMVMYAGNTMEYGTSWQLFKNPLHPYTQGLLASIPRLDKRVESLYSIKGTVPKLSLEMKGCKFASRCPYADDRCRKEIPPLFDLRDAYGDGHKVSCWRMERKYGNDVGE
ncbi:MAG: ABC transporter ATP-binding protein [Lachnospiraceae bacterium]|nr:ABC transporter ATP-binding protein [Lachnospiraceae bacterium]